MNAEAKLVCVRCGAPIADFLLGFFFRVRASNFFRIWICCSDSCLARLLVPFREYVAGDPLDVAGVVLHRVRLVHDQKGRVRRQECTAERFDSPVGFLQAFFIGKREESDVGREADYVRFLQLLGEEPRILQKRAELFWKKLEGAVNMVQCI